VLSPVTVSWLVTSAQPSRLSGSVTVRENGDERCGGSVSGQCGFTPASAGSRTITVAYSGDDAHEPSSDARPLLVQAIPTQVTSPTSNRNPANTKDQVTFEVQLTAAAGSPQGSVAFSIGVCGLPSQLLGSATLSNGVARLTRRLEAAGTFCVTAAYGGSPTHAASQSPPPGLLQVVEPRR
jgi:hypothetical protein